MHFPASNTHPFAPKRRLILAVFCVAMLPVGAAWAASCLNEKVRLRPVLPASTPTAKQRAASVMSYLVRQAMERSETLARSQLLALASNNELNQARATRLPRADLSLGYGRAGERDPSSISETGRRRHARLSINGLLYDSGQTRARIEEQRFLASAGQLSVAEAKQQIALQTVILATDRSRYFKQAQVLKQHVTRLTCLVEMLEKIVSKDSGRRSELVQAEKTLLEAQLSLTQSESRKSQTEHQLRRYVGSPLPRQEGLTTLWQRTPETVDLESRLRASSKVQRLNAKAGAATAQLRAVRAQRRPRLDWELSRHRTYDIDESDQWRAGINLVIPLFDRTLQHASRAATHRAQAAEQLREEAMSEDLMRAQALQEQAQTLTTRIEDIDVILAKSNQLRRFTLKQWRSLGRRSLFDVMSAERDHYAMRIAYVDALHDKQLTHAQLHALGGDIIESVDQSSQ